MSDEGAIETWWEVELWYEGSATAPWAYWFRCMDADGDLPSRYESEKAAHAHVQESFGEVKHRLVRVNMKAVANDKAGREVVEP